MTHKHILLSRFLKFSLSILVLSLVSNMSIAMPVKLKAPTLRLDGSELAFNDLLKCEIYDVSTKEILATVTPNDENVNGVWNLNIDTGPWDKTYRTLSSVCYDQNNLKSDPSSPVYLMRNKQERINYVTKMLQKK